MFNIKKSTEVILCGGRRFTVYHWSPTQVMRNLPKIGRLVAVPLGTVVGENFSGGEAFKDAVPTALLYIMEQLDEGGAEEIMSLLLEGIEVDSMGGPIDIDAVFDGHVEDLLTLLAKVIEVNYSCFFGKSGSGIIGNLFQKLGLVKAVQDITPQELPAQD